MICLLVFAICWLCSIYLKTRHPELHRFWFLKSHKSTFLISGFVFNEKFQQKIHKIYYTFYRYKIPKWLFLIFDFCATLCFPWNDFTKNFVKMISLKYFCQVQNLKLGGMTCLSWFWLIDDNNWLLHSLCFTHPATEISHEENKKNWLKGILQLSILVLRWRQQEATTRTKAIHILCHLHFGNFWLSPPPVIMCHHF